MEKQALPADREELKAENGASISDETLRLYLLGTLGEDQRLRLDEHLLVDDELAEQVVVAESALIDDYATQRLTPADRALFESRFLITGARREKLRLSQALRDYASRETSANRLPAPSWSERLAGLFAFNSPRAWAVAGSFAVLLLLVAVTWLIIKRQQETPTPQIAKNEPATVNSAPAVTQTNQPGPAAASQPSPPPAVSPSPDTPPTTVASFVLMPGALRSSGDMTRVAVPGGERDMVRLGLVVETPAEGSYQAELATAEGQKVLVRPNLKITRNGHAKIVLTIPARLLHTRDYQIKLTLQKSDGQSESAGRYYFRAQED